VSAATKLPYAVSLRYAKALIELGIASKKIDKIEDDLKSLALMVKGSEDLQHLIRSPSINPANQLKAIMGLAEKAKFDGLTTNFLGVLVQNRRLYALLNMIEAIQKELAVRRGEVSVKVQTAQDLSEKQKQALQDAISKSVGKEITLQATVEPSILGGMIVTVGSHMIDDSVARKLERLQTAMGKQSNENLNIENLTDKTTKEA
jgi:F-type H+-transporting ATPase subunit delta